jgi:spermidine/putrescine transport system permease protein
MSLDAGVLPDDTDHALVGEEVERRLRRNERRRGLLLALPAYLYMILFFAVPLVIVLVYSFATRTSSGSVSLSGWNLDSYRKLGEPIVRNVVVRSATLAGITTGICLLFGYPFAYFAATRSPMVRNLMLVAVMIPFWTNFLVRNYAWRLLLSNGGPISSATEAIGLGETNLLFTRSAVVLGLTYSFLPFMILPLYASIERMDKSLVEASYDLGHGKTSTLFRVIIPAVSPGLVAGVLLVFIPAVGDYITPALLGGVKTQMIGTTIADQFRSGNNWPLGSAMSVLLMAFILIGVFVYLRRVGEEAL